MIKKEHIFRGVKSNSIFPPQDRQRIKQYLNPVWRGVQRHTLNSLVVIESMAYPISLHRLLRKEWVKPEAWCSKLFFFFFIFFVYICKHIHIFLLFYLTTWMCSLDKIKRINWISQLLFSLIYAMLINMKEDQEISLWCWITTQVNRVRGGHLIWCNNPPKNCLITERLCYCAQGNVWNSERLTGEGAQCEGRLSWDCSLAV